MQSYRWALRWPFSQPPVAPRTPPELLIGDVVGEPQLDEENEQVEFLLALDNGDEQMVYGLAELDEVAKDLAYTKTWIRSRELTSTAVRGLQTLGVATALASVVVALPLSVGLVATVGCVEAGRRRWQKKTKPALQKAKDQRIRIEDVLLSKTHTSVDQLKDPTHNQRLRWQRSAQRARRMTVFRRGVAFAAIALAFLPASRSNKSEAPQIEEPTPPEQSLAQPESKAPDVSKTKQDIFLVEVANGDEGVLVQQLVDEGVSRTNAIKAADLLDRAGSNKDSYRQLLTLLENNTRASVESTYLNALIGYVGNKAAELGDQSAACTGAWALDLSRSNRDVVDHLNDTCSARPSTGTVTVQGDRLVLS